LIPERLRERLTGPRFAERVASTLARGREPSPALPSAGRRFAELESAALRVGDGYDLQRIDIAYTGASGKLAVSGPGITEALRGDEPIRSRFGPSLRRAMRAARRAAAGGATTVGDVPRLMMWAATHASGIGIQVASESFWLDDPRRRLEGPRQAGANDGLIKAPMAGKVLEVRVADESAVAAGDVLFVVESMKMQLEIRAPADAVISRVLVEAGQILDGAETMAESAPG